MDFQDFLGKRNLLQMIVFGFFLILFTGNFVYSASTKTKVLLGIDVLQKENFESVKSKRIGLVTNHTGVDSRGKRTVEILKNASQTKLVALFAPEHGFRGQLGHGSIVMDERDQKTGILIYSLYGKTKRPSPEMLESLDAVVFDIQDIGTRFYTYTTTLAYLLEECAKKDIELIVLDRPNPINGTIVEGEVLHPEINHFTAYLKVPVRHGMTVGELANWYNRTSHINARLKVIKMEGWKRYLWWEDTNLRFVPTSPNIRNFEAALLYSGIGAFEATNVSVGRGTKKPFKLLGAPWMDGVLMAERLNFFSLPGFKIKPAKFVPKYDLYKGEMCKGIEVSVEDKNKARPFDLFVQLAVILRDYYPDKFILRWEEIERVTGSKEFKTWLEMGHSAETILFLVHERAAQFQETVKPYLLY
ncbi:MAG: DUF1343 domain-containing protein [Elusimicrobia bacterium]|nr:DUF1343 domain-containing protein [Elusimicrobiota bacterium]